MGDTVPTEAGGKLREIMPQSQVRVPKREPANTLVDRGEHTLTATLGLDNVRSLMILVNIVIVAGKLSG